jgi:signal transduction histidine kinase
MAARQGEEEDKPGDEGAADRNHQKVQVQREVAEAIERVSEAREAATEAGSAAKGVSRAAAGPDIARTEMLVAGRSMAEASRAASEAGRSMAEVGRSVAEVERNVAERNRDVAEATRDLAEAQTKEAKLLMSILSHDLRNPLNAIITGVSLLRRRGTLDENDARTLAQISASAERMAQMIGQLLDLTQSRLAGGISIHPQRIDLHLLCARLIEESKIANPDRVLRLEMSGDGEGEWDPDRLMQALDNLVSNALKHGESGAPVSMTVHDEGERVLVEVHNEGEPIPEAMLPHIFERFRRGAHDRAGLGLGLYIADQIVIAHGGSLRVESPGSGGTTFRMILPRRAPEAKP